MSIELKAPDKPQDQTAACTPHTAAKWAAVADDVVVPMPNRHVPVHLIKSLAGIPSDFVLVRDHNSPNDVVLKDDAHLLWRAARGLSAPPAAGYT